ncbi:DUF4198 domain-containing protein [Oceanotoga sp. DSM 15011]|uniref:DUF4198 domain-containing protein n=1 Tax=Oceanotoga sp. DSM 15011 TaxID=2984951 RepID=UPI0021F482C3|nr:DUF4198 domain-containing protein [Oceanotoga sp. DSM 15011]UYP01048.1 DUF4198 domain-containing protein [Oceanotoga sp. DSM 15011]
MKKSILIIFSILMLITAFSHFQLVYTEKDFIGEGDSSNLDIQLIFTHPGGGTHDVISDPLSMNMGKPKKFGVWNKGEYTDLTDSLKAYTFSHGKRNADAYKLNYRLRGMGDFVFVIEPEPYWEASEEIYITQYTKAIVNKAGLPSDWDAELGLPAEIVPLTWPTNIYAGSTFRGVVMKDGKPEPNVEIEIEYLNAKAFKNAFNEKEINFDGGEAPAMLIKTDSNGQFSFTFPWSGVWGFAALMEGEQYKGQDQELGACFMLRVHDLP